MNSNIESTQPLICPHCNEKMVKMVMPPQAGYDSPFMYVCFNDECPYFIRGWKWMKEKYNVNSSYRHRLDPKSGKESPLPVWSVEAMKNRIIE